MKKVIFYILLVLFLLSPFLIPPAQTNASFFKTVFLTSGTSFTVPSDWNSINNTIEVIGAGGGGSGGANGSSCGKGCIIDGLVGWGGGGGAYSKISNLPLTPGATVTYQVGAGGLGSGGSSGVAGGNGTDTYFNHTAGSALTCADTTSVCAKGGVGSSFPVSAGPGGAGGASASGTGTTKFSGGGGSFNGIGGGGAAGLHGAGNADQGSNTGGTGDAGFGGAAGSGNGTEYDSSHGSGGGGAGSANGGAIGSNGGTYGAGGGGGSGDVGGGSGFSGGNGASGLIIITYNVASVAPARPSFIEFWGGFFRQLGGSLHIR
jgi:hypothetical protein